MANYQQTFIEAIERTKRLNLKLDVPVLDSQDTYIKPFHYEDLRDLLCHKFPEFINGELALQCATVSYFMKPLVDKYLECESLITCGYFILGDATSFFIDEDFVIKLLKEKQKNRIIGFHVWLTLPSLEIIDFTIGQTYARVGKDIPIHEYVFKHPNTMQEGSLQFHPVILGEDFLRKTGYLID
ncbi:hypothetical protein [Fluviicola sp.]|uniref:hypothetical protein n=1 Tax=Fluviicola sp. TaxID=1917219 RepID=UPI0031CFFB92